MLSYLTNSGKGSPYESIMFKLVEQCDKFEWEDGDDSENKYEP